MYYEIDFADKTPAYTGAVYFSQKYFDRGEYKLHREVYHPIKSSFNLSAQMVVRCISKVADSYKLDKKVKREFRILGAITYDARILSYTKDGVSLWSVDGRLKGIKFVCHNPNYLPYIKGEADLVFKKGKFYLFQTGDTLLICKFTFITINHSIFFLQTSIYCRMNLTPIAV